MNSSYGILGDGTFKSYPLGTIIQAKDLTDVVAIDTGMRHSLALKSDGTVLAWGTNEGGQLGDASTNTLNVPTRVIGLDNVVAVAGGLTHTLALRSDGTVWACGRNIEGELGRGNFDLTFSFVNQVDHLNDVVGIAAGSIHNLALKADGTVWAWGANSAGQLGDGTNNDSSIPVQVKGLANVAAIAAGGRQSLALIRATPNIPTSISISASIATLTTTFIQTSTLTQTLTSPLTQTLTTTSTTVLTTTSISTSTSTHATSSPVAIIDSWWVWLICGSFVFLALVVFIWRRRHKTTD
jgi:hypothetical protein